MRTFNDAIFFLSRKDTLLKKNNNKGTPLCTLVTPKVLIIFRWSLPTPKDTHFLIINY